MGKARSLPLEWSLVKGYTREGHSLMHKCKIRLELATKDEDTILQYWIINYDRKIFYSAGQWFIFSGQGQSDHFKHGALTIKTFY